MVNQHYSRYPVYEEDLDHIIGTLHFRDAVKCWLEQPDRPLRKILRKPVYVHEAMDINELLTQMRQNKTHQAIVVDGGADCHGRYSGNHRGRHSG